MIKNQANIYQFVLRDMIGQGVTGLTPTVQIRKDSGSFAATTNAPTEVGYGAYEVTLTATECNCNVMMFLVTLPDGQFPAILENERLTTTGGATPAEIWGYPFGRTVDNTIPTVNEIWGREAGDTTSRTLTNLNIQSELTTYGAAKTSDLSELSTFDPSTDDVTINATQAATLAAASDLDSVATKVELIKSKTDNLPENPAAVTDVTTAQADIIAAMPDISGLSTFDSSEDVVNISISSANAIRAGLSTFDPTQSYVIINPSQAATMQTATGFATPANVTAAQEAIIAACSSDSDASAIAEAVWNRTPRTLTSDPNSSVVYCNTSQLYAHWTQAKIDAWANGNQTNIDNAILSASRKIDSDLAQAASTPFQPVPADIRDLAILAAGVTLARQAGDLDDPGVTAAIAYYQKYIEDYNYTADN